MQNNDAQEFLNQLMRAYKAEAARHEITSHSGAFPKLLDEVAITLKKHGLDESEVRAALLALCGVPICPITIY